ncbi:hypothetical protein like AT2G39540 [Hibiscus trionum]|uniref:Snakin-1 n=1 Tax=Hibiscus trionum TaxID=183268 RepID=A0A9W7M3R6_HIBTR|nr:hypothetical protein like AT2G39540 [Hibiscus trionum]
MKLLFATSLFVFLFLTSSFAKPRPTAPPPPPGFCDRRCGERCAKAGVKDRCLKYCGICCQECKCVPSGTFGHKSECPCYRDKLNSKGHPKCP